MIVMLLLATSTSVANAQLATSLEITPLDNDVYLHTSYREVEGWGRVGANGLVVIQDDAAYIVDTPWSVDDTAALVDWITSQGLNVAASVSTHSHADRTAGIGYLNSRAIATYTSELTAGLLKMRGAALPSATFADAGTVLGAGLIEVFFAGPGHTPDNLVVWLPGSQILLGGCLVRSQADTDLGFVGEAHLDAWANSVRTLQTRYPNVKVVIPGHGQPGGTELLVHTWQLASDKR